MKSVVEQLETRRLLAVTINNGLLAGDADYYEATISGGGEPVQILWGGRNVVSEFTALLDLGEDATASSAQVVELSSFAVDNGVAGTEPNTAQSLVRIVLDDDTANDDSDNPVVTVVVSVHIPNGETRLETSYSLSSSNYDLKKAKLFQYWSGISGEVTSDFVTVRGGIATHDLKLITHNTQTYNHSTLEDGPVDPSSHLSGFAIGEFPAHKALILAGDYDPPATGDILIPSANLPGVGPGYGPVQFATSVLEYALLSPSSAKVNAWLSHAVGDELPMMEVRYVPVLNEPTEILVPDDYSSRDLTAGTDFGTGLEPVQHIYRIYNHGRATLELGGLPRVEISGTGAEFFRVIRQPTQRVGAGAYSTFIIEYVPASSGISVATVRLYSNDLETTPYSFQVFGGSGTQVAPDPYEVDDDRTNSRQISTDGVWKVHSLHRNNDVDWSVFELTQTSDVLIQTTAPIGDTRMKVFDAQRNLLAYDNDSGPGVRSQVELEGLSPGLYYIRIDEYGMNATIPVYALSVLAGDRPCPKVGLNQKTGHLGIFGTGGDDTLAIDVYQTSYRVTLNGQASYWPLAEIKTIFLNGGWGNDTIFVGAGIRNIDIRGDKGDDYITVETAERVTVFGGAGNDIISSGDGSDFIRGKAGDDIISGGGGNDSILGGEGHDQLLGGAGNDSLMGEAGNDEIFGEAGDDLIAGGEGDDTLDGGAGADLLQAGSGSNYIDAQDGVADTIYADSALDVITSDELLDVLVDSFVML